MVVPHRGREKQQSSLGILDPRLLREGRKKKGPDCAAEGEEKDIPFPRREGGDKNCLGEGILCQGSPLGLLGRKAATGLGGREDRLMFCRRPQEEKKKKRRSHDPPPQMIRTLPGHGTTKGGEERDSEFPRERRRSARRRREEEKTKRGRK